MSNIFHKIRCISLLSCLAIVSCHPPQTFQTVPVIPAHTAAALESRRLDNPALKTYIEHNLSHKLTLWPPQVWDFPLLTQAALYYHPDMDVARAQWSVANAGVITAGQRPNPSIKFSPAYVPNIDSGLFGSGLSPWILGFSFDIPVEIAGKRGYRIAQARALSTAAQLNIAAVAWKIRSRLRASLISLYAAERGNELLWEQQRAQEQWVKVLEERLSVGAVPLPEVTQAHLTLQQTRLALTDTRKQIGLARADIAAGLGLPAEAVSSVAIGWTEFEPQLRPQKLTLAAMRKYALSNRADILQSLANYAATQSALQLEIARQYPNLNLGSGYTFENNENRWTLLSLSMTPPLFNQNQGPIAEAKARREEAVAQFTALQTRVLQEIDQGVAATRAFQDKLAAAEALLATQDQHLGAMQKRFNLGEIDRLTLLSQQLQRYQVLRARLDTKIETLRAWGQMEDGVQYPLTGFAVLHQ